MRGPVLRFSLLGALVALLVGASGVGASGPVKSGAAGPLQRAGVDAQFVPGELVVQFRSGVSSAARGDALRALGGRVVQSLAPGLTLVRLSKGASVRASAAALARDRRVLVAEPNYIYRLTAIPNDTFFPQLWGLHQASDRDIDAPEAWNLTTGSSSVIVAVIDSGVAYDHPDLAGNMWVNDDPIDGADNDGNGFIDDLHGWDTVQEDAQPFDYNGHGTHVAGTIGAVGNNADGVTGVNWDVSLMAVRAGDANGLASSDIFQGVQYACNNGAHVVNGSFGGSGKSQALANLIKSAACRNTLFVFAAGNDAANLTSNTAATNSYPCEYHRPAPHGYSVPNIVCVASSTHADGVSSFSNRGGAAVHLAAPGGNGSTMDILSTWPAYESVWADDFEGTAPQFEARWGDRVNIGAGSPPATPWTQSSAFVLGGASSLADSPSGNYAANLLTTIRNMDANAIDLSGRIGCLLEYPSRVDVEFGFDFFGVFAGGEGSTPDEIGEWTGSSGGQFALLTSDLSAYDGDSSVFVRFFVDADETVQLNGVFIDNVAALCLQPGGEDYNEIAGTSMASPHVAGVAALLRAARQGLTVAKLKNALLKGVEKKSAFTNHVSTGGRLNARYSISIALDTTRPNTTITAHPPNRTTSKKAKFKFRSNQAGSTFQCKHMNGAWRACSSPKVYKGLGPGKHNFAVRATDTAGNVDSTPAKDTWRIRR